MTTTPVLVGVVMTALAIGSAGQTYRVAEAPADLHPAIQRGELVIISVQSAVLGELGRALAEGGPEYALMACHLDAAGTALRIARTEGVRVGRTSARLRNPGNAGLARQSVSGQPCSVCR